MESTLIAEVSTDELCPFAKGAEADLGYTRLFGQPYYVVSVKFQN